MSAQTVRTLAFDPHMLSDLETALSGITSGLRLYLLDNAGRAYRPSSIVIDQTNGYVGISFDPSSPVPLGT